MAEPKVSNATAIPRAAAFDTDREPLSEEEALELQAAVYDADAVDGGSRPKAPDSSKDDLLRRIEALEVQGKARDDAATVKQEEEAKEASESGWFSRALTKVFETVLRIFCPVVNLVSLAVRLAQGVMKGEFDWKGIMADAVGALPMLFTSLGPIGLLGMPVCGLVAGGYDLGSDLLNEKKTSRFLGWESDKESGFRVAGRKLTEVGGNLWDGSKKIANKVAGKVVEATGPDPGIASDPLPSDIDVE
jgi:hypothetical protein